MLRVASAVVPESPAYNGDTCRLTILLVLFLLVCGSKQAIQSASASQSNGASRTIRTVPRVAASPSSLSDTEQNSSERASGTNVEMRNVVLREGGGLKMRVRWLRGVMYRTRPEANPSLDERNSFSLDIQNGVLGF